MPLTEYSAGDVNEEMMKEGTELNDGILRRTVLKASTVGVGMLALGVPATAALPADEEDDGDAEAEADSDKLTQQLLEVRDATRPYWTDVARAREDGFDGDVSPFTPGMGFHFVNPNLIVADEDASVDLAEPAILVYIPTEGYNAGPGDVHDPERDDELVLAAVEFAHNGSEGASMDLFADEDSDQSPRASEENGWQFVEAAGVTALHVWVPHWNPAGVFHPTNPAVE